MLIRSLRLNESIVLTGGIEVVLTEIGVAGMRMKGGHVKLGIAAPAAVRVHHGRRIVRRQKPARKS